MTDLSGREACAPVRQEASERTGGAAPEAGEAMKSRGIKGSNVSSFKQEPKATAGTLHSDCTPPLDWSRDSLPDSGSRSGLRFPAQLRSQSRSRVPGDEAARRQASRRRFQLTAAVTVAAAAVVAQALTRQQLTCT